MAEHTARCGCAGASHWPHCPAASARLLIWPLCFRLGQFLVRGRGAPVQRRERSLFVFLCPESCYEALRSWASEQMAAGSPGRRQATAAGTGFQETSRKRGKRVLPTHSLGVGKGPRDTSGCLAVGVCFAQEPGGHGVRGQLEQTEWATCQRLLRRTHRPSLRSTPQGSPQENETEIWRRTKTWS